jgi:hypothetical protein
MHQNKTSTHKKEMTFAQRPEGSGGSLSTKKTNERFSGRERLVRN